MTWADYCSTQQRFEKHFTMTTINFPRHDFASSLFASVALCFFTMTGLAAGGALGLVPLPQTVQRGEGVFLVQPSVRIFTDAASRECGEYLAARLRGATAVLPFMAGVSLAHRWIQIASRKRRPIC